MTAPAAASNRRAMIILAVGAGILALAFIGSKLAGGGGGDDEGALPGTGVTTTLPGGGPASTTTTTPGGGTDDLETFEVFTTKNPFLPLSGTGSGGSGQGSGTGAGTGSSGSGTGSGTGTGSGSGAGTGGSGTGSGTGSGGSGTGLGTGGSGTGSSGGSGSGAGGGAEPSRSERVSLLEIFVEGGETVANVRVNDTVHKVGVGDTFASRYRVISLSQSEGCGRFVFGDDQFRLCRGEQVLK